MIEKLICYESIDEKFNPTGKFQPMCYLTLIGKINEIIDHINNQQPKKPKSTNIALRQRIAELERINSEMNGENVALVCELMKYTDVDKLYKEWAKEGYFRKMPNVN